MADTTFARIDVLAKIDQERAWWEGILSDVGENRMDVTGVTDLWSFKDLIAHLNGWQRRTLDRLAAGIRRQPIPATPWPAEFEALVDEDHAVEVINTWIFEQTHPLPAADIVAQSRAQWDELRALVEEALEDDLNNASLFPNLEGESLGESIVGGGMFEHFHEEHGPMITDWLRKVD